ncbi:hypothetical protein BJY04DRAFT_53899 [Aspergillus karnatakaensis]|uniref:uncharacterized protein n=1 Tax=Aspergillus karnatakaensis TaxID=1810916 RepID=UPI003CCD2356
MDHTSSTTVATRSPPLFSPFWRSCYQKSCHRLIMPPVAPVPNQEHAEKRTTLKRLMKELNIRFHLIDDVRPSSLRREFEAVRTIGNATYEENVQRSSSVTLERTKKILRAVRWCLEREQNEEGWRQEVEAKILEPLTEYHKCSKCDKRLWRADFEFPVGDGGGKRWDDLRARRLKRDKCDCPSSSLE